MSHKMLRLFIVKVSPVLGYFPLLIIFICITNYIICRYYIMLTIMLIHQWYTYYTTNNIILYIFLIFIKLYNVQYIFIFRKYY